MQFLAPTILGLAGRLGFWPMFILQITVFGAGLLTIDRNSVDRPRLSIPNFTIPVKITLGLVTGGMMGLATAHLARLMGADRHASVAGALLVAGTPHLVGRVNTVQVDVALAAMFLSSCVAAVHVRRGSHGLWTVMLLVLGGTCAAVKFSGGIYWVASMGFLLVSAGKTGRARSRLGRTIVIGLAVALICGGYWYLRNMIQDGSPFGRIGISVAGRTLLAGEYGGESMATSSLAYALATGGWPAWQNFASLLWNGLGWLAFCTS